MWALPATGGSANKPSLSQRTSPKSSRWATKSFSDSQASRPMCRLCTTPVSPPCFIKFGRPLTVRNELFRFKTNMYRLREERGIEPKTLAHLVSSTLYEKRFGPYFISPVVAGINSKTNEPFICGFDNIGFGSAA